MALTNKELDESIDNWSAVMGQKSGRRYTEVIETVITLRMYNSEDRPVVKAEIYSGKSNICLLCKSEYCFISAVKGRNG